MSWRAMQLADMLIAHVRGAGILDLEQLSAEPRQALGADSSIQIKWVAAGLLPPACSIAATYDPTTEPATIAVAKDASLGRRRFSLLHEYGHHLRNQVFEVMEALFDSTQSAYLEEKMCDAFASRVLVPEEARRTAFVDGVTASSVVALMSSSNASAQAVAVAAAESMDQPGYVVLLNRAGEAVFAARSGDVFPAGRGVPQTGLLKRASRGIVVGGVACLDLGGGSTTRELNVQSAVASSCVVAVMVDGPAPWTQFSAGRTAYVSSREGWCDHCSEAFTSLKSVCQKCGELECPNCDTCGCGAPPVAGERQCSACFTLQPPAAFDGPSATSCRDCSA